MATKSIFKNVSVKDRGFGNALVSALENAEKKTSKEVVLKKKYVEPNAEQINKLFGEDK